MDSVAKLNQKERDDLFNETAARKAGVNSLIAEKDFWVCWVLDKLVGLEPIGRNILFKGGTSLSKAFQMINRFSEDIDLSISREILGLPVEDYLTEEMSGKERDKKINELDEKCTEYIHAKLLPLLIESFAEVLGDGEGWSLKPDEKDSRTLLFTYPTDVEKVSDNEYLKKIVRLELGAYSVHMPSSAYKITSYAAEEFPNYFTKLTCEVKTLEAIRTFWEKITLLHAEYHRSLDKSLPERYSRHYYDVCLMIENGIGDEAIKDTVLLDEVSSYKMLFHRCAWARYEEARKGSLKLVPKDERMDALKHDYQLMQDMIFSDAPDFEYLIKTLSGFEKQVNG